MKSGRCALRDRDGPDNAAMRITGASWKVGRALFMQSHR